MYRLSCVTAPISRVGVSRGGRESYVEDFGFKVRWGGWDKPVRNKGRLMIKSRYASVCRACKAAIGLGDIVWWAKNAGCECNQCGRQGMSLKKRP